MEKSFRALECPGFPGRDSSGGVRQLSPLCARTTADSNRTFGTGSASFRLGGRRTPG